MGIPIVDRPIRVPRGRAVVASLHVVVGAMVCVDAVLVLLQVRANLAWELGFYGRAGLLSKAMLLSAALALAVGGFGIVAGFAWAAGGRIGRWVLFAALMMMCFVPEPVAWLLLGGSVFVFVDQWRALLAARRPLDD